MHNIMEESPLVQEDPPSTLPLQCVLKENDATNLHWQDYGQKGLGGPNSKLLFLTVEYIQEGCNSDIEFNNYSPSISENERLSPFDPNLSSSGRYSPLYNTLIIPADGQSQCQNSVVVLPTSRNEQQISIVVDQLQVRRPLLVEDLKAFQTQEISQNIKLNSQDNDNQSGCMREVNCDQNLVLTNQKLKITSSSVALVPEQKSDYLANGNFFQGEINKILPTDEFGTPVKNEFSLAGSHETVLMTEAEDPESKSLLEPSKYVIGEEKQNELLLSEPHQNNDLLLKSEVLMGVDSYSLAQSSYITSGDGSSYPIVEDQLNVNNIEKPDNEYMLANGMAFEDTESSLLQSNMEVFTSQGLDNNLLLYDKTRLRQTKKHATDHLGLDFWCEDCEFELKCRRHEVKIISDKPVPSRARATLPKELLAINKLHSNTNEEGVFARKTIMRRVQFGPVEGKLLKDWDISKLKDSDVVHLLLEVETGHLLKLDVSDEHESNWMRFVRKATTLKEQNLVLTQQGKSLYFTTTRIIPPRHELKVGYSPQYAEKRKLTTLEDLSWNCFECTAKFSTSDDLQKHLSVHENEKEFSGKSKKKSRNVSLSGLTNLTKRRATYRSRSSEDKSEGRENECWSCHKIFPRTYSLKRHMILVHSEKDKENSEELKPVKEKSQKLSMTNTLFKRKHSNGSTSEWLCTHCNLTFDNPSVLNLHTLTHAAEDLESEAVLGLPSELSSVYHEGEFLIENGDVQCPQCTQEFPSKRQLIDHVSTHGKITLKNCYSKPSKPYKCDQCYKAFPTDIRLQKHMLVHGSDEAKPYQCEVCLKRFLNNSALSCHRKTHSDKKSFECPLCKKEFDQVFGLKDHVKVHSSDGFFTCPHCSKVFEGYSVVRKHIRAFHSGHQHTCKDCGKMCPTLDKLRMHSLKHSDHREFLCANCGKQFKRKDKLKEHMKRMHSAEREMKLMSLALRVPNTKGRRFTPKMSPLAYDRFIYKCRSCMVGFKRRGMLVNHLAKRHPDIIPDTVPELNLPILKTTREYFCQYCDKIYKSSSKRKAHILKNHPGAELPMSNRQKGGVPLLPGIPNPTFSKTVGSVKTNPHRCKWCHKQYASKAKLLQHQRKKHVSLLPKSQQVPRVNKSPSSPVGSKITESLSGSTRIHKPRENKNENSLSENVSEKIMGESDSQINEGDFNVNEEIADDPGAPYKKTFKVLPENISCELLHQAMTELSQSLSDYKIPFGGAQENLLKIMGSGEAIVREDTMPAAQMTRTWPDLPPYPPR